MRLLVGVAAGGTKTVGLLADESGTVLRQSRGGGANLVAHGELAVEKALYQIFETLDVDGQVAAICLGIAGVDRAEDKALLHAMLRRLGFRHQPAEIVHDAPIALVAGRAGGAG